MDPLTDTPQLYLVCIDEDQNPSLILAQHEGEFPDRNQPVASFVALNWEHAKKIFLAFLADHELTFEDRERLSEAARDLSFGCEGPITDPRMLKRLTPEMIRQYLIDRNWNLVGEVSTFARYERGAYTIWVPLQELADYTLLVAGILNSVAEQTGTSPHKVYRQIKSFDPKLSRETND